MAAGPIHPFTLAPQSGSEPKEANASFMLASY